MEHVYEAPLVASLAFFPSLWAEPSLPVNKKFVPEQVHILQNIMSSRREPGAMDLDNQELASRAQKERGPHGVDVLIPELIHRFFRAHSRIRSPHIDDEASVLTLVNFGVNFPRASLLVRHARATSLETKPLDLTALVNAELEKELGAINRAELGCVDEGLAMEENVFTALLQMVGARLAKASTWCPICRQPHASPGMRLRPCNDDICLYRFEELSLSAAILPEVLDNPELVELKLAMAASSARADAVFEPFPSFLLQGRENRGRPGLFNASPSPTSGKAAKKPVAANAQDDTPISSAFVLIPCK